MNCERLDKVLFWTIIIDVPIIKGPRVGTTRSKACGEAENLSEAGSSIFCKVEQFTLFTLWL
jgi:hypothetical protein